MTNVVRETSSVLTVTTDVFSDDVARALLRATTNGSANAANNAGRVSL